MDKQSPCISVVMSIYNGEKYLREAVDSILNQTFKDFEFIIIDDDSTDRTAEILDCYTDPRISRLKNEKNIGLAASLNKGIAVARCEYIARMDADDISLPIRFETQLNFLSNTPDVAVVGANFISIDEMGRQLSKSNYPDTPGKIRWRLLFENAVAHPLVMFRRSLWVDGFCYDETILATQDYDLWSRISEKHKIYNLRDILLHYRGHSNSISQSNYGLQKKMDLEVVKRAIKREIGFDLSEDTILNLRNIKTISSVTDARFVSNILISLQKKTKSWNIDDDDHFYIRQKVAYQLKKIWDYQSRSISLLPVMGYAILLYPNIILNRFIDWVKKEK